MFLKSFERNTLKSYLLLRFLPPVVLAVIAVTAWSVASSWLAACYNGQHWAEAATLRLQDELIEIKAEADLVKTLVEHSFERDQIPQLPPNYMLLRDNGPGAIEVLAGEMNKIEPPEHLAKELRSFKRPGLYELNKSLVYATPFSPAGVDHQDIYLLKVLADSFADRMAIEVNAEVAVLLAEPEIEVATTSLKNLKDERVSPHLTTELLRQIKNLKGHDVLKGSAFYNVPNYRGMFPGYDGENAPHRGESTFRAFHAFVPIYDELQRPLGYFAVIVPEDVLLAGTKRGMLYSILCGLAVALLGAILIVQTADRFAAPMSELAGQIDSLSRGLHGKYSKYRDSQSPPLKPVVQNEIESLRSSVELLKKEMTQADRIEQMISDERARAMFAAKMAAIGEMAAGVAHEVNNPLAVIHAIADELTEKAADGSLTAPYAEGRGQVIKATAKRAAVITRTLLRLSRDSSDDPKEWYPVRSLIFDAETLVRDELRSKNIAFAIAPFDESLEVFCSSVQISQVILNLISNSMDAISDLDEKWIRIDVQKTKSVVSIRVFDSGQGIDENIRGKLMEPFVTTKPPGRGTGLGLSISRKIIEDHQGSLSYDEKSENTCFVVQIPIGSENRIRV